jgi:hypothetical protein
LLEEKRRGAEISGDVVKFSENEPAVKRGSYESQETWLINVLNDDNLEYSSPRLVTSWLTFFFFREDPEIKRKSEGRMLISVY